MKRSIQKGFTLIELMIVVAIMGIVLTMGVPLVYRLWHKEAMRKAVGDVLEVCSNARAQAILQGKQTELVFHPREKQLQVVGAAGSKAAGESSVVDTTTPAPTGSGLSAQIPDEITIEMLDVNLHEFKDADEARIIFYPNGTCDEMTLILRSDRAEWRKIALEVTTSLATVETEVNKFR